LYSVLRYTYIGIPKSGKIKWDMRALIFLLVLSCGSGLLAQQRVFYGFERLDGPVAPVLKLAQVALHGLDHDAVLVGEGIQLKVQVRGTFSQAEVQAVLQQSTGIVLRSLGSPTRMAITTENSAQPVVPEGLGKVSSDDVMALLMSMAQAHGGPSFVDSGNVEDDMLRFEAAMEEWSIEDPAGSSALMALVRSMLQDR
jgi:hypothetical protein